MSAASTVAKTFYVTTPIYYPNDIPHIGHGYTTVAADVLARWRRLCGDDVFLLTGTDEHGENIARAAAKRGMTPQQHVDDINPRWHEMLDVLGVSNSDFIRTTEARHTTRVQEFMQTLYDNGDIYLDTYRGWYCVSCEAYYAADELIEGSSCPVHRRPAEQREQENYFFRLSAYADRLLELYDTKPAFVQPDVRRNEVRAFVAGGLQDVSVSRTSFTWGVPVPWDPEHVFYVWFDALLNYATAAGFGADPDAFARRWPADVHLIGKDLVRFHCVYWPAMLMAAGLELPRQIFAHGFLLVGGEKMSKTNATGVHPGDLVGYFGRDCYRYYFLREISFGQDGSFSWESMEARYTTDLAGALGNLANRVLNMVGSYCDGVVPEPSGPVTEAERALSADLATAVAGMRRMDALEFKRALEDLWVYVSGVNRYVETRAPWRLNKEGDAAGLTRTLYTCVDALRVIAVLISPVMPDAAAGLWSKLGLREELESQRFPGAAVEGLTPVGSAVDKGELLFPKLPEVEPQL